MSDQCARLHRLFQRPDAPVRPQVVHRCSIKASLKTGEMNKFHYKSYETTFKLWYNNHNQSFKENRKINFTELSKTVWKLKQSGQSPQIR